MSDDLKVIDHCLGAVARYGGVFEFDATDLAAGNAIDLWIFGS